MKDVVLVTSHTPDSERKAYLRSLLKSINRQKFDIVVSTNTPVSEDVWEMCDFVVYDKSNHLIHDFDKKIMLWWGNGEIGVRSSEIKSFNHIVAAQTLILNGLNWCKYKGYQKLHFLEYDSLVLDDSVFEENSEILEHSSIVWYDHPSGHGLFSSYSLNLEKLPLHWFNSDLLQGFLDSESEKIIESYGALLLGSTEDALQREFLTYDRRIKTNLFNTDSIEDWAVILGKDHDVYAFVMNNTKDWLETLFILNNEKVTKVEVQRGHWNLIKIGATHNVQNAKIIVGDKVKRDYDFSKIDKIKFFEKNFLI